MYKSRMKQIVCKFAEKLIKSRILFKDILTFLGIDFRNASLIKCILLFWKSVFQK